MSLQESAVQAGMGRDVGAVPRAPVIVEFDASDLASTKQQIGFALQMMALWTLGAVGAAVLGSIFESFVLFALLTGIVSGCLFQMFFAGIARIVTAFMQREHVQGSASAWRFLRANWLQSIFGGAVASFLVAFAAFVPLLLVRFIVTYAGSAGTLFGALAIYPAWLLVLFALPLLWNCQLLAVVMGVENCGAMPALKRLVGRNPLWFVDTLVTVFMRTMPMLSMSLILTGIAAVGALGATAKADWSALMRPSLANYLTSVSYLLIFATWLAFAAATVASEYAIQYANKRR